MSNQLNQNPSRVSFDPRSVDIEMLDEIAAERGISRAELIRETLTDVVEDYDDGVDPHAELHKPEHPELREAFEKLLETSNHPQGPRPITTEEAKSKLHTQECPKAQVKRRLLRPLANEGFISATNGRITVHRRTLEQVKQAEKEAQESLSRLEEATIDGPEFRDVDPTHEELLKYQRAGIAVPFRLTAWTASETLWSDEGGMSA